jgi:predicted methyltransferase
LPRQLRSEDGQLQLFLGDCHQLLDQLPDASVQLLYSDPPFGITMAR